MARRWPQRCWAVTFLQGLLEDRFRSSPIPDIAAAQGLPRRPMGAVTATRRASDPA